MDELLRLALSFMLLSLEAVGGGTAVLPEMESHVAQYGISSQEFVQIYSLGQLAPGPNMTMVLLFGQEVAGPVGALVVLFAFFVPAAVLAYVAGTIWNRIGETPWRRTVQNALAPISVGLMLTGIYAIAVHAITGPLTIVIAAVVLGAMVKLKVNAAFLVLGAAVLGAFALAG